jgi:hypothetical protein
VAQPLARGKGIHPESEKKWRVAIVAESDAKINVFANSPSEPQDNLKLDFQTSVFDGWVTQKWSAWEIA